MMDIIPLDTTKHAELFDLMRTCLGERETSQRNKAFWAWKHEANPFGRSIVLLGQEAGLLVGLRAFLRWQWTVDDNSIPAVRAVDTVTHPDYQRRGIFSTLTKAGLQSATKAGVLFVFNTPNSNSMPGYLKMGWKHVDLLPMQIKILHPLRFAAGIIARTLCERQPSQHLAVQSDTFLSPPLLFSDFISREAEIVHLLTADLRLRGGGYTTLRSIDFLKWRYADHPSLSYYVETVKDGNRLLGILIWRLNERYGLKEAIVCDVILESSNLAVMKSLVRSAVGKVKADYMIAHFGQNSAHRAKLSGCGFFTLPGQGMNLTVRDLGATMALDPCQARNWSLCLGDLEIF